MRRNSFTGNTDKITGIPYCPTVSGYLRPRKAWQCKDMIFRKRVDTGFYFDNFAGYI